MIECSGYYTTNVCTTTTEAFPFQQLFLNISSCNKVFTRDTVSRLSKTK